jgi:hypothetical protein
LEEIPTTEELVRSEDNVKGYSTWTERSDVYIPKKLADLRQKLHHRCMPVTKVSANAGCGKSACPV